MELPALERDGTQTIGADPEGFGADRANPAARSPVHARVSDVAGGTRPATLDLLQSIPEFPPPSGSEVGPRPTLEEPAGECASVSVRGASSSAGCALEAGNAAPR
eukprot:11517808-Alexandrium_andersonii.AAC.1